MLFHFSSWAPRREENVAAAMTTRSETSTRLDIAKPLFDGDRTSVHIADARKLAAGAATLIGVALLIYRRRTSGPVFAATTKNDKTMYVFLVAAICLGILATMTGAGVLGDGYNYRETVSVWFRSIFLLQPQGELMADTPLAFQVHALAGMALFVIWPFTRLVHAFSAPVGYLFRPYIVYRTRSSASIGNRPPRRGWDRTQV